MVFSVFFIFPSLSFSFLFSHLWRLLSSSLFLSFPFFPVLFLSSLSNPSFLLFLSFFLSFPFFLFFPFFSFLSFLFLIAFQFIKGFLTSASWNYSLWIQVNHWTCRYLPATLRGCPSHLHQVRCISCQASIAVCRARSPGTPPQTEKNLRPLVLTTCSYGRKQDGLRLPHGTHSLGQHMSSLRSKFAVSVRNLLDLR